MTTIRNQPTNVNYALKTKFRFVLNRAPNVSFFCQEATIPQISLSVARQKTPFMDVVRPGNKIEYEFYPVTFKVDEDLANYLEIFDWMNNLGFPDDFSGYDKIKAEGQELVSDATMLIETSKNNPNIRVVFRDMFPITLSELQFAIDEDDVVYQDATVTFCYQRFTVDRIKP